MKKKLKLFAVTFSVTVTALVSLDGSTSMFPTAYGQSSSQKWKAENVQCYDDAGKIYATAVGCFGGLLPFCNPRNCPPKPAPPVNPPD